MSPRTPYSEKSIQVSRRSFLQRCTALAAATSLPLWYVQQALAQAEEKSPSLSANDKPGIALIGCGGMGMGDANNALPFGEIVAVCDVDQAHLDKAAEKFTVGTKVPTKYTDYRKVLEDPRVHVVINATPDHWHTLINVGCAKAKKDVYAEKPLTLTVAEGRHLVGVIRDSGIILQTGTQQRSSERFRLACELIRNGRFGKLKEANVYLPQGLRDGPFGTEPVPEGFNWDFWLGQAPKVDYVRQRAHGTFRFWYDYSGGTMTDWGAHHNDIAYWAVGLIAPTKVESTRLAEPVPGGYDAYNAYEVRYTYENGVGLNIHTTPDDSIYGAVINQEGQRNGIRFTGTDGWLWVNRDGISASDNELIRKPLPEDAERLYRSRNHMQNFFDCVRSRKAPICDVETGHRSANMCHLGAISLRTGRTLQWDYNAERFVGEHAAEGNAYLSREMRAPYDLNFF